MPDSYHLRKKVEIYRKNAQRKLQQHAQEHLRNGAIPNRAKYQLPKNRKKQKLDKRCLGDDGRIFETKDRKVERQLNRV